MKLTVHLHGLVRLLALALCAGQVRAGMVETAPVHTLHFELAARYHGAPVEFGALSLTNRVGQCLSFTRLDLLLSGFAVRGADGTWHEQTNAQAFVSLCEKRPRFVVNEIPTGDYDRIRFHVGLPPELNHADPAKFPAKHPLNPNLNGMHWGWSGGYVFAALEGRWRNDLGVLGGFSFHLGNDPMLMTVELPVGLQLTNDVALQLALAVDRLFDFYFARSSSSTHSRPDDDIAERLKKNLENSFQLVSVNRAPAFLRRVPATQRDTETPSTLRGTPYRFTFSAQFPIPELPRDNPLTEEGVALGERLFHDPLLSINGRQSCASCHQAAAAFADAGKRVSAGAEGQAGSRNAMPLFNLAWKKSFFWDGRAKTLREQVLMPIENPAEMHESLANVVAKLAAGPAYPAQFEEVFGSRAITADRIARVLEQFLLTQISGDAKFDRALTGKEKLSELEQRGFELFMTEFDPRRGFFGADCFHCHGGPLFTSQGFANIGLDARGADAGRSGVTKRDADEGKFAIPSLRNVALTAPYMHDGRFQTLEEVIDHYRGGINRNANLDPNIAKHPPRGIPINNQDKAALVAFLKTLTDSRLK